jgi:hypothetical protein
MSCSTKDDGHELSQKQATGYLSKSYAESLSEFGNPRFLPESQGWILDRQIPGTPFRDSMGCYPLFFCQNWSELSDDIENIDQNLISFSMVADPFGKYNLSDLRQCFKDIVLPFKTHYMVDLRIPLEQGVSAHHRYYARKSNRSVNIFRSEDPLSLLDDWQALYEVLIARHEIKGIKAFSKESFRKQLMTPGITVFCSEENDSINGMQLWYTVGNRAYHHLSAYSPEGYRLRASYGLMGSAMNWFRRIGMRWLDLGGVACSNDANEGLAKFKSGWTSLTRTVFFCGRILNHEQYNKLVKKTHTVDTKYFPAYRDGEFIG